MAIVGQDAAARNAIEVALKPDKLVALKVYVSASPANLAGERSDIEFKVSDKVDGEQSSYSANFNGPSREEK